MSTIGAATTGRPPTRPPARGPSRRATTVAVATRAGASVSFRTRASTPSRPAPGGAGRGGGDPLPAVVREGLVGLRHAVDVVLALVRAALLGARVHQLVGEPLGHRLLPALTCELDEPADGQ